MMLIGIVVLCYVSWREEKHYCQCGRLIRKCWLPVLPRRMLGTAAADKTGALSHQGHTAGK